MELATEIIIIIVALIVIHFAISSFSKKNPVQDYMKEYRDILTDPKYKVERKS